MALNFLSANEYKSKIRKINFIKDVKNVIIKNQ